MLRAHMFLLGRRRYQHVVYSDFRQVPDTQELFIFPDTNVSMILEVLERVDQGDPVEATKSVLLSQRRAQA
jgi:hypothetical protein